MAGSSREQLLTLLAEKSFRLGQFKLSSGGTSDYYIDCRLTTLDASGSLLTGQTVLQEIEQRGWKAHAIGGLTMGADPIVVATSVISAQHNKPINGFLVRKAEKAHGTGQRIEGFREKRSARGDRRRRLHYRGFHDSGHRGGTGIRLRNCRVCFAWWSAKKQVDAPMSSRRQLQRRSWPSSQQMTCVRST